MVILEHADPPSLARGMPKCACRLIRSRRGPPCMMSWDHELNGMGTETLTLGLTAQLLSHETLATSISKLPWKSSFSLRLIRTMAFTLNYFWKMNFSWDKTYKTKLFLKCGGATTYSQFQNKSYKVSVCPRKIFRQPTKMGGKRKWQVLRIETL